MLVELKISDQLPHFSISYWITRYFQWYNYHYQLSNNV